MILCSGEALIAMVAASTADGEPAYVARPGGSPLNVAVSLGRLAIPVGLFAGISTDHFGTILLKTLQSNNVDTTHVRLASRPTTLAFAHLRDGKACYAFHDEYSAGRMLIEADLPKIDGSISALLFSGISLVSEPSGSTHETLMRRSCPSHVTMLDPNIRPAFIGERAAHVMRMRRMIGMADIVKLSEEDLAWFEEPDDLDATACRWLKSGPKVLVVTRGHQGSVAYTARSKVEVPARRIAVVDTIGAGDAASAALLAWLHDARMLTKDALDRLGANDLRAALTFAMRVSAASVTQAGANPPWREELAL